MVRNRYLLLTIHCEPGIRRNFTFIISLNPLYSLQLCDRDDPVLHQSSPPPSSGDNVSRHPVKPQIVPNAITSCPSSWAPCTTAITCAFRGATTKVAQNSMDIGIFALEIQQLQRTLLAPLLTEDVHLSLKGGTSLWPMWIASITIKRVRVPTTQPLFATMTGDLITESATEGLRAVRDDYTGQRKSRMVLRFHHATQTYQLLIFHVIVLDSS